MAGKGIVQPGDEVGQLALAADERTPGGVPGALGRTCVIARH